MQGDRPLFRYLNRDGLWPGFHWDGLELSEDGSLRLTPLPRLTGTVPENLAKLPQLDGPAGIAADIDGTIYFTSPGSRHLCRVNGCSGETEEVPCLEGELKLPGALLLALDRRVLFIADLGGARILLIDADTLELRNLWTGFITLVSLAGDAQGNVYVADSGAHRVDKFLPSGDRDESFWQHLSSWTSVDDPRVAAEGDAVFVLDRANGDVYITDASGEVSAEIVTGVTGASAVAVVDGALYIGDAARGRVVVFRKNASGVYVSVGDASGYNGPIVALAGEGHGALLVSPGSCLAPLKLAIGAGCRTEGVLWSGAIAIDKLEHFWNRFHASITLPAGAHAQFFVYTDSATPPPVSPADPEPFPEPWRAIGLDITDFFVGGTPSYTVAIGARFTSDLNASPELSQLLVAFDQESYLSNLPAIYRERTCGDFLLRFLSLFESFFAESESTIDALPALLDPAAAPAEDLPWLASFLAFTLPEMWTLEQQRKAIAGAFAHDAKRGTVAGLVETLQTELGIRAVIVEPIQNTGWWVLPAHPANCFPGAADTWTDGAVLGFNTVLATAEPQGAVVGATATLDQSHLLEGDAYGTPLFEEVAHQFTVQIFKSAVDCPGKIDEVEAIIAREAPAHTMYQVCVVEPGVRVGYQCRVGIDTVLGMGHAPTRLGDGNLVLGGEPRGEIGMSHVGMDTRL